MAEQKVTLTISLTGSTYSCTKDPTKVPYNGQLEIIVPSGGCLFRFDEDFKGEKSWSVPEGTMTINMKGEQKLTNWTYDVVAPNGTCNDRTKRNRQGPHSIQIGS